MLSDSILIENPENGKARYRIITIHRPHKRNALDHATLQQLIAQVKAADADKHLRALIITGSGDAAFCSGADLAAIIQEEGSVDGISAFGDLFLTLNNVGIPIIAAVNGVAVGGGLGILLASDLVVMSENAKIGAPEVKRGLFAMFISRFVYQSFPEKVANQMLLLGEMLDAKRALELGVVNAVVSQGEVLAEAVKMAHKLCELSGSVLRTGKRAIRRQRDYDFEAAMQFLGEELKTNLRLNDSREGISAFLEKRHPAWSDS
jgi:enoyl-CoA hydratase/carnithine racemase